MSGAQRSRRGRLARLDDAWLGTPGTRHGWYGDLFLGLHPWLRPVYALVVLAGVGMVIGGAATKEWGLVIIGGGWLMAGLLYLYVLRGKAAKPPSG
jgi:hypothetical protein